MSTRTIATAATAAVSLAMLASMRTAAAQVVIQQPVVGRFGVATAVSVPDRGRAVLGSVSRAGAGRVTHGPFRSGTAIGVFHEHSAVGVHAWIHDLDAMDRELLRQGAPRVRAADRPRGDLADHAYRSLLTRWPGRPSLGPPRGGRPER